MMDQSFRVPNELELAVSKLSPLVIDGLSNSDLEEWLAANGWQIRDAKKNVWSSDALSGYILPECGREGNDRFEVNPLVIDGDVNDGELEAQMADRFAIVFDDGVERVTEMLGEPDFIGHDPYGDGFPEEIDAARIALWQRTFGGLFVAYLHEDSGLPFRITVIADLAPA